MIQLYAIINEGNPMELYVHEEKYRREMESLLKHILKKIQQSTSKVIKSQIINSYHIYYFSQSSFLFVMATQSPTKSERMNNYLRVVADIFYDNYDQKKFKYILEKIMEQINRTQFGVKKPQQALMEDEESYLVSHESFLEQKSKLSRVAAKNNNQSRLAYSISVVLYVLIVILCAYYLVKNWN